MCVGGGVLLMRVGAAAGGAGGWVAAGVVGVGGKVCNDDFCWDVLSNVWQQLLAGLAGGSVCVTRSSTVVGAGMVLSYVWEQLLGGLAGGLVAGEGGRAREHRWLQCLAGKVVRVL